MRKRKQPQRELPVTFSVMVTKGELDRWIRSAAAGGVSLENYVRGTVNWIAFEAKGGDS